MASVFSDNTLVVIYAIYQSRVASRFFSGVLSLSVTIHNVIEVSLFS